jgi:hypothetical protein
MRKKLQEGWMRVPATIGISTVISLTLVWCMFSSENFRINFPSAMQKIAFISAAFAVTAYNLRTRVVDFVLKLKARPRRMEEICREARETGIKLTNLVLFFTVTSLLMGSLGFLDTKTWLTTVWVLLVSVTFSISCVSFVYVVFAFEKLEGFVLDEHEELARSEEAKRLL